jgi:hypothetical protein
VDANATLLFDFAAERGAWLEVQLAAPLPACAGGRVTYARLEALCLTDPARALDIVRSMASLSVERMKEHFHPRASDVVIVASPC